MSTFEDRLWIHLTREHGADAVTSRGASSGAGRASGVPAGARPAMIIVPALVAIAAAAIVLLLLMTEGTQPAYALSRNADGSITVTINDLQRAIPELNERFAAMGIDETVVPIARNCPTQMEMPVFPQSATGDTLTFTPHEGHKYLAPGFDGVLAAGYARGGRIVLFVGAMKPPLPACFPADPAVIQPNPEP